METDLFIFLSEWNGKDTKALTRHCEQNQNDDAFLPALIALVASPPCQRGATWCIKHLCQHEGKELASSQRSAYYKQLPKLTDQEAVIHILQCLDLIPVPEKQAALVAGLVTESVASPNKFVRAWSYYGFARLAATYPEFRPAAETAIRTGEAAETAGSIKVRLRKAREILNRT